MFQQQLSRQFGSYRRTIAINLTKANKVLRTQAVWLLYIWTHSDKVAEQQIFRRFVFVTNRCVIAPDLPQFCDESAQLSNTFSSTTHKPRTIRYANQIDSALWLLFLIQIPSLLLIARSLVLLIRRLFTPLCKKSANRIEFANWKLISDFWSNDCPLFVFCRLPTLL